MSIGLRQVLEIDGWNGSVLTTFKYTTLPAASGMEARIIDPGLLQYTMFSSGKTFGASIYAFGSAILDNTDNGLDNLATYSFDGRAMRLFEGPVGNTYPTGFNQVFAASIDSISFDWDSLTFTLRDRQADMAVPIPTAAFAGTCLPATPTGVGGGADLLGKRKPLLLGRCFNIKPTLCNPYSLIYEVSSANGIDFSYMGSAFQMYDNGTPWSAGLPYASQLDMETSAPLPGQYRVWEAGGYFRINSATSDVTCDAVSKGRAMTAMPGNLIVDLLTLAAANVPALSGLTWDASSITALNGSFKAECGVYLQDGDLISDALDKICSACGAYWYFSPLGVLTVGQFKDPMGLTPAAPTLATDVNVYTITRQKTQDTVGGIPAHTITLLRSKNYTVMTSPVSSLAADRKAWLAEEFRKSSLYNAGVKTSHPLSQELVIETCLTQDNPAEVTRRAALYNVPRDLWDAEVPSDIFPSTASVFPGLCLRLDLTDYLDGVGVVHRYNTILKNTVVVGFTINRITKRINLTLWG